MGPMDAEFAEAFDYFLATLGEPWSGWENGAPLAAVFNTSFQRNQREWVRFFHYVRALKRSPLVDALVRRELGSKEWTLYMAAGMALEFCGRLSATGHAAELVQNASDKIHDANVDLCGRQIAVEFKALHDREEMKSWHALHDWVGREFGARGLSTANIDVECGESALENREVFLDALVAVKRGDSKEIAVLPEGTGRAQLSDSNTNLWRFPVDYVPPMDRIASKLEGSWWKKFRKASFPTLVVVRGAGLLAETVDGLLSNAQAAAHILRDALAKRSMVSGLVVYDEVMWVPPAPRFFEGDGFRLHLGSVDGIARAVMLVARSDATIPLDSCELESLVGPTMKW